MRRGLHVCVGVSGNEFGLLCEIVNGGVEGDEGSAEWRRGLGGQVRVKCLEARAQGASVKLGEEEGNTASVRGEGVAQLSLDPADESLAGQAAQVVAHLAGGVRGV